VHNAVIHWRNVSHARSGPTANFVVVVPVSTSSVITMRTTSASTSVPSSDIAVM